MTERLPELRTKGVQIVRGLFDKPQFEALGAEIVAGIASGALERSSQFVHGVEHEWFKDVATHPKLLELAVEMLGEDLCINKSRVLMKDEHFDGPIECHQDWPYFGGDTRKLNVFIPLTPVSRRNGGLTFFEESHLYGPLERGSLDIDSYQDLKPVCPELEIGDVLLADILTWHHSTPSEAPGNRIMIQLVYQPSSDPSSKELVRGQLLNTKVCEERFEPVLEPRSHNYANALFYIKEGDLPRATSFIRGLLADDPDDPRAALLMYDVSAAQGLATEWCLTLAQTSVAKVQADLRHRLQGSNSQSAVTDPQQERIRELEEEIATLRAASSSGLRSALSRLLPRP